MSKPEQKLFGQNYKVNPRTGRCEIFGNGMNPWRSVIEAKGSWGEAIPIMGSTAGGLVDDLKTASKWLRRNDRKEEAQDLMKKSAHFRSGGQPTGRSLFSMMTTLVEIQDHRQSAHGLMAEKVAEKKAAEKQNTGQEITSRSTAQQRTAAAKATAAARMAPQQDPLPFLKMGKAKGKDEEER